MGPSVRPPSFSAPVARVGHFKSDCPLVEESLQHQQSEALFLLLPILDGKRDLSHINILWMNKIKFKNINKTD